MQTTTGIPVTTYTHIMYVKNNPKHTSVKRNILEKIQKQLYTECAQWQRFTLWFVGDAD